MRGKSMILIVIALGCGLVASIGISKILDRQGEAEAKTQQTKKVYVAVRDVNISEVFDAETIKLEEWPADKVPEGAAEKLEDVVGLAPNQRLYAGEVIRKEKLVDPASAAGKSFLIPKGYRVQAVSVKSDSAVGHILTPGDHVDVQVYLRKGASIPQATTKTILEDVRVFAVNAETEKQIDEQGKKITAKTVSLLVKPDQLQTLLLASRLGQISLSLRHPDDDTQTIADGGASLHDLLNGASDGSPEDEDLGDLADVDEPAADTDASAARNDFTQFLETLSAPKTAETAQPNQSATSEFKMQVLTPDGIQTFSLIDDEQLSAAQAMNPFNPNPAPAGPGADEPNLERETQEDDPDYTPADDSDHDDGDDSTAHADDDA